MAFNSPAKALTPLLEVSNLSVAFGKHTAVDAVNFYLAAGEVVVILGANGAGKSTLLKSLGGMVQPHPGAQVSVQGSGITGVPAHLVVEAGVALVPEGRGIFGELSVRENLLLGGFAKRAREELEQNLGQVFSLFPRLQERQAQIARTMSGGEQQMVAIGRALMSKPKVLMLDEPSLGLSPILSKEVFRAIARVAQSGVGVLLVEQNARLSLAIADRGYVMENGRMGLPYTSNSRKVPALWNIASKFDRSVLSVGWWVSWPAEPVNGRIMASYAAQAQGQVFWKAGVWEEGLPEMTYPEELIYDVIPLLQNGSPTGPLRAGYNEYFSVIPGEPRKSAEDPVDPWEFPRVRDSFFRIG